MKPISEMTPEELRREIAEALGWSEWWFDAVHNDGLWEEIVYATSPTGEYETPPDWPGDTDAALDLFRAKKLSHNIEYDARNDSYYVRNTTFGPDSVKALSYGHKSLAMVLCMVYCVAARG